jgi:hypothetical protein
MHFSVFSSEPFSSATFLKLEETSNLSSFGRFIEYCDEFFQSMEAEVLLLMPIGSRLCVSSRRMK